MIVNELLLSAERPRLTNNPITNLMISRPVCSQQKCYTGLLISHSMSMLIGWPCSVSMFDQNYYSLSIRMGLTHPHRNIDQIVNGQFRVTLNAHGRHMLLVLGLVYVNFNLVRPMGVIGSFIVVPLPEVQQDNQQ